MSENIELKYRLFTQQYSALMDGGFAKFFEAESMLSKLTISETLNEKPSISLQMISEFFNQSRQKLESLINLITESKEIIAHIWYAKFYNEQVILLVKLHEQIEILCKHTPDMETAILNGRLQESLLHEEENSDIRKAGIAACLIISAILSQHSKTVTETNRI
jgi:hypothetical protein